MGLTSLEWCEQIQFHLGVLDLDLAFQVEKPIAIATLAVMLRNLSIPPLGKIKQMNPMFMRMSIANNIKSTLPHTKNAKEFMMLVGKHSQTMISLFFGTLMATLTTMKFDGSRSVHEHVIEMTNIAARLKSLGMNMYDNFLVRFILNSSPSEYGPFQMNYNTMKDKWNLNELHGR
ncbi:hypothetical protein DH2020_007492 [Rehmannia glutinosa]|uniref:Uncharacterized protein n=1 Tax=Rehmannia glutinosa TaxID=99300 RepID=A0ABR0TYB2_REHGL